MGLLTDPNHNYQTGVDPLPLHQQGYLGYGDPLDAMAVKDNASKIDTRWHDKEREMMKQAVINAFRVVLLSPLKDLKWNAIHYQDISGIPYNVTDPNEYWSALEQSRQEWNAARGRDPLAHLAHYPELMEYYRYYEAMHPRMDPREAREAAECEVRAMQTEIEERLLADAKGKDWRALEPKVFKELKKRLRAIMNPKLNPAQDVDDKGTQLYNEQQQMTMAKTAGGDWFCPSYGVPDHVKDHIHQWVQGLPWPEGAKLKDPSQYHITSFYSPTGYSDPSHHEWLASHSGIQFPAQAHRVNTFAGNEYSASPVVLQFHAPELEAHANMLREQAAQRGLAPASNPGGALAHVTIGNADNMPTDVQVPDLQFRTDPMVELHNYYDSLRHQGAGQEDIYGNEDPELYGGFIGNHLYAIALIGQYADELADAALRDLHEHDGAGWHFRKAALSLNIKGVGPKVASFAWLLLQPMTSQLATIDTHMMDMLGHDYDKEMNNRDYFKYERELQAGRDAAGYEHVPLGQFQWGLWDVTRTGAGSHQDHSALRALNPEDYRNIDWGTSVPRARGMGYTPPEWWLQTAGARQQVADDFDRTVAPSYGRDSIPYGEQEVPVTGVISKNFDDEVLKQNNNLVIPINRHLASRLSNWAGAEVEPEILVLQAKRPDPRFRQIVQDHNLRGCLYRVVSLTNRRNTHETGTKDLIGLSPQLESAIILDSREAKVAANAIKTLLAREGIEAEIRLEIPLKTGNNVIRPALKFPSTFRA